MRKGLLALFSTLMILALCGCAGAPESALLSEDKAASPEPVETLVIEPFVSGGRIDAEEVPTPAPPGEDEQAALDYREFLSENYDLIMEISFKTIAGIGFIDLDLDGSRELILFDAGASASMGVQLFDIIDGEVECVSANIQGFGETFGGEAFSDIIVNANFMEDFRLREDNSGGERFFIVESRNGNVEAVYNERLRFENHDGILALSSVFYKYEEFDTETNQVLLKGFRIGGDTVSEAEYTAALESFDAKYTDAGLECRGVFIWENNEYIESYKNFMENVDKALELYEQNRVS